MTGTVSYHFSGNFWANNSAAGFSPVPQDSFTAFGEASHVPNFGQEGLFVFLGGEAHSNQNHAYEVGAALANMSPIPVHDIHSGQWYHQITTGNIPPGRSETLSGWNSVIR